VLLTGAVRLVDKASGEDDADHGPRGAHELVHLVEPLHTATFWRRLERMMPDFLERKRSLLEWGQRVAGL
jgi:hypothetical protein